MKPDPASLLDLDCLTYLRINALHRRPGVTLAARTLSHSGDGHLYFAVGLLLAWFGSNVGYEFFIAGIDHAQKTLSQAPSICRRQWG
jgi:hypothetical protein